MGVARTTPIQFYGDTMEAKIFVRKRDMKVLLNPKLRYTFYIEFFGRGTYHSDEWFQTKVKAESVALEVIFREKK